MLAKRPKTLLPAIIALILTLSVAAACTYTGARKKETEPGTSGEQTSATDVTTAPETTARELYEPNVRQLCCDKMDNAYSSIHTLVDEARPLMISSSAELATFIENGFSPCWDDGKAIPAVTDESYGFPVETISVSEGSLGLVNENAFYPSSLEEIYNDEFFSERVLFVMWYSKPSVMLNYLVSILEAPDNGLLVFSMRFSGNDTASIPNPGILMETHFMMKFIEVDKSIIEGKTILDTSSETAAAIRDEWYAISGENQSETHAEDEALLRETYGDEFYYIEPWQFASLYGG